MKLVQFAVLGGTLVLLGTAQALAQAAVLTISLYGSSLQFPAPDWVKLSGGETSSLDSIMAQSEQFTEQAERYQTHQFVPKGEKLDSWRSIHGVLAVPGSGPKDAKQAAEAFLAPFSTACVEELRQAQSVSHPNGLTGLVVWCGQYRDDLNDDTRGLGEVAVAVFSQTETLAVRVYREWRGTMFDPADTETWPITQEELDAEIGRIFETVQLTPGAGQ